MRLGVSVLLENCLLASVLGCHVRGVAQQTTIPAGGNPSRTLPELAQVCSGKLQKNSFGVPFPHHAAPICCAAIHPQARSPELRLIAPNRRAALATRLHYLPRPWRPLRKRPSPLV